MSYNINSQTVIDDTANGYFNFVVANRIVGHTSGFVSHAAGIDVMPFVSTGMNAYRSVSIANRVSAVAGHSSLTDGYSSGGGRSTPAPVNPAVTTIERFPFASPTSISSVGNLTTAKAYISGQQSTEYAYVCGGDEVLNPIAAPFINTIERFSFANPTTSSSIGTLTAAKWGVAGISSSDYGYVCGGSSSVLERFPFAAGITNATNVGNLTTSTNLPTGMSSHYNGYVFLGTPTSFNINKFPFASALTNATSTSTFDVGRFAAMGMQSLTSGYLAGGRTNILINIYTNYIEKFDWAADTASAYGVDGLTVNTAYNAGHQY